jgi:hypothetical protein
VTGQVEFSDDGIRMLASPGKGRLWLIDHQGSEGRSRLCNQAKSHTHAEVGVREVNVRKGRRRTLHRVISKSGYIKATLGKMALLPTLERLCGVSASGWRLFRRQRLQPKSLRTGELAGECASIDKANLTTPRGPAAALAVGQSRYSLIDGVLQGTSLIF